MFKAVCSKCGNECELPFKPSGDRPVFCSKCFEKNGDFNRRTDGTTGRQNSGDNRVFDAVCDKCGKPCKVPFQPTPGKPVYCSRCFEDKSKENDSGLTNSNAQLVLLNAKLDKVLTLLNSMHPEVKIKKIKTDETKDELDKNAIKKSSPRKKVK